MAPAGAALALSAAVGGACVERDLPGYRFGWRQFARALGAMAVVASLLPFASWAGGGQWGLPASGAESAFAFPAASPGGDYRVLWLGTPGSLPMASQGSEGGLVFATSLDGLPSAGQLWVSSRPGEAPLVASDLRWADDGQTTALGHLLAPLAVRYVVVQSGRPPTRCSPRWPASSTWCRLAPTLPTTCSPTPPGPPCCRSRQMGWRQARRSRPAHGTARRSSSSSA